MNMENIINFIFEITVFIDAVILFIFSVTIPIILLIKIVDYFLSECKR